MSGLAIVLVALAGAGVGVAMTAPINSYLAVVRDEGIAARPAPTWGVAVVTAAAFALATAGAGDGWHAAALLVAATGLAAVSVTDIRAYRIANRILFPSIAATAVTMVIVGLGPGDIDDLWRALIAGAIFSSVLFIVAILAPSGGLGLGDVKLAILLGMVIGWVAKTSTNVTRLLMWAVLLSALIGVISGIFLAVARKVTGRNLLPDPDADPDEPLPSLLKTAFPFGPGLVLGTLIVVALSETFAA